MQIILLEKVGKLGNLGDVVKVKDGYARNYLIPTKLARRATEAAIKEFEVRRADLEKAAAAKLAAAQALGEQLAGKTVRIAQKAGVDGRLFGSVTNHDVAEALTQDGPGDREVASAHAQRSAEDRRRAQRQRLSARRRGGRRHRAGRRPERLIDAPASTKAGLVPAFFIGTLRFPQPDPRFCTGLSTARSAVSSQDHPMSTRFESRESAPRDDEVARLRVPPHSVEAEQSVLGGLLLDNLAWDRAGDLLTDSDFYRHEHRLIFAAIGALVSASKPADVITVFEQLQNHGKADDAGGLAYLNALAQSVPSAANMRRYAEIVRERAVLRKLIAASDEIATNAFNPQGRAVTQILDEAEGKIFQIGEEGSRQKQGFQGIDKLVVSLIDRVQELHDNGAEEVTGVRTGYFDLDRQTAGLQKGDLIILAARPSMGKTAFALNIAEAVAVVEGLPVLVFSMEMGAAQLALRLVGSLGRIDQQNLRTGRLRTEEWERLTEAVDKLGQVQMFIDETPALTGSELRARARRMARQYGQLGLIVIDYLQLMSGSSNSDENRATEIGEISRGLKALAKELQCPVIALSQLNRSVETRNDKRPMMSDLRESGAIEQDADIIMFIYRDDYYNKESKEQGVAEIIIAKQRNGPVGTVKLAFLKPLTKFENLAPGMGDEY